LAYASQSENRRHRALSKSQKIRMRLGGSPSILELFPDKPPRMHRRTYGRLFNKAAAAQDRWMAMERDYMRRHYPGVLSAFDGRQITLAAGSATHGCNPPPAMGTSLAQG
jgi:hypothetical protein